MADRPVTRQDLAGAAVVVILLLAFTVLFSVAPREWRRLLGTFPLLVSTVAAVFLLRRARRRREQAEAPPDSSPPGPIEPD